MDMGNWLEEINRMMTTLFLFVFLLIILLVVLWIIFEVYPKWKRT